jgi:hypothetical protein
MWYTAKKLSWTVPIWSFPYKPKPNDFNKNEKLKFNNQQIWDEVRSNMERFAFPDERLIYI